MVPAVRLITCEPALLDAAVAGDAALGQALGCAVADGWAVFPGSLQRARDALAAKPAGARWGPRLFVVGAPRTLVGWGGFKGDPDVDGAAEVGYAIAPAWAGRGVATAAVAELLREAWEAPEVRCVVAHTLPEPNASVRVLEKSGFARDGENLDGDVGTVWRFRLDRPDRGRAPGGARTPQRAIG